MLSALLPGLREARTPLIVGYIWVASLWICFGESLLSNEELQNALHRLGVAHVPLSIWLAVLSIGVYLLGSLLTARSSPFSWVNNRIRRAFTPPAHKIYNKTFSWASDSGESESTLRHWYRTLLYSAAVQAIKGWLRGTSDERWMVHPRLQRDFDDFRAKGLVPVLLPYLRDSESEARRGMFEIDQVPEMRGHEEFDLRVNRLLHEYVDEVVGEREAVEVRLQIRFPALYGEIDRLRSEGELRYSLFWPLIVLVIVLASVVGQWTLILLIAPVALAVQGRRRIRSAEYKTWSTVTSGEVGSPTMDEVAAMPLEPVAKLSEIFEQITPEYFGQ